MFRECDERKCGRADRHWSGLYFQRSTDTFSTDYGYFTEKSPCGGGNKQIKE
jgi:hypothetical protein